MNKRQYKVYNETETGIDWQIIETVSVESARTIAKNKYNMNNIKAIVRMI